MNLKNYFDKVVCINLDRRADRWQRFQENVASAGWPFREIERFAAVDGHNVPAPGWWRAGGGAWGCHQSHVRILQQAIQGGAESVLILEDDAVLPQRFPEVVEEFLTKVPGDWDGIMLGGQHLRPPDIVDNGIVKVRNGNRTHAHALRGNYIKDAYRHLCDYPNHAQRPRFHVDHRLGMLHESGQYKVYAPSPWLIGQANGRSDIAGADFSLRFWSDGPWQQKQPDELPPFVAVVGLHRSGSSALAGVLHKLGVHLGNQLGVRTHRRFRGDHPRTPLRAGVPVPFDRTGRAARTTHARIAVLHRREAPRGVLQKHHRRRQVPAPVRDGRRAARDLR